MIRKHLAVAAATLMISIAPALVWATDTESTPESTQLIARSTPVNAAPLGLELGYANIQGLKATLKRLGASNLQSTGFSKHTLGPTFKTQANDMGIEGLRTILFIFSKQEVLEGVLLTFDKDPNRMAQDLAAKYELDYNEINRHLNYGEARFSKGDSFINISSAHLGFHMDVFYLTKGLNDVIMKMLEQEDKEAEARRKNLL